MLAPQTILACQMIISPTELLKKKTSKYALATLEGQKPTQCPMGENSQKLHSYIPSI